MNKEQLIKNLELDSFPTNYYSKKQSYDEAETAYYENLAKAKVALTPLAGEVAKARQRLIESRDNFTSTIPSVDAGAIKFIEKKVVEFEKVIDVLLNRVATLENALAQLKLGNETKVAPIPQAALPVKKEEDDDVDLFGSDSEDENEAAAKIREDRLAAYAAKKSKKPVLIAKSNLILDIKPWDDETDLKVMEESVRKIETEGLLWGASKLVPLAYTIKKLQISCVVEDEKVSIDWLTEQIEALTDYVQSVDIAAFNKI